MTTGLREVGPDDLQAALEQFLAPRLASLLAPFGLRARHTIH